MFYTFSVSPTIPESKNVKVAMKKTLMKKKVKTLEKEKEYALTQK